MKDLVVLKMLDKFKMIYIKFGINYDLMRLIVKNKLIMDGRRGSNLSTSNENPKDNNAFYKSLIIYAIVGSLSVPIIHLNINPMIKMSLYFISFMIMILSVFISDFSSVILDVSDKEILQTKGIDMKTLNAAKFTHVFIYMSLLSISINFIAILSGIRFGLRFILVFILDIFLINIFMIIITAIMYFIIIKLFSGEKLKDILNIFQVIFILFFVLGYQIIIRAFSFVDLNFVYIPHWWNILIPPMWFSSTFNIVYGKEINNIIIVMSILAIVVPILSIFIYVKSVPKFEHNLYKLSDNTYIDTKNKYKTTLKLSKIICKDKEERAFFNFTCDILKKDREFKTKIYPSLAMGAFVPFLMIMSLYDGEGIFNFINSIKSENYYLYAYMFVLMSQSILTTIKFSKEYEASWIYDILPIKNNKNIYSGTFKASIYKLIFPLFVIMSLLFILIFSAKIILDILVIFMATILSSMLTFKINKKYKPFSQEYKNTNSASNILTTLNSMFFVLLIVVIHMLVVENILFTFIYLISLILIIKISWNKVFVDKL